LKRELSDQRRFSPPAAPLAVLADGDDVEVGRAMVGAPSAAAVAVPFKRRASLAFPGAFGTFDGSALVRRGFGTLQHITHKALFVKSGGVSTHLGGDVAA